MKVLLVLPAADHLRVTGKHVPKRKMLRFSVLSLTTVAALTPSEHNVTLCDENVQALDFDAPCDVVGVSFMTALATRAYEIADEFRRRGKIVVAGGFHATFRPEEAAEHFDAVVIGEAEGLWPRVLEDIQRGRPERSLPRRGVAGPGGCARPPPRPDSRLQPPLRDDPCRADRAGLPPRVQVLFGDGLRPPHPSQPAARSVLEELQPSRGISCSSTTTSSPIPTMPGSSSAP